MPWVSIAFFENKASRTRSFEMANVLLTWLKHFTSPKPRVFPQIIPSRLLIHASGRSWLIELDELTLHSSFMVAVQRNMILRILSSNSGDNAATTTTYTGRQHICSFSLQYWQVAFTKMTGFIVMKIQASKNVLMVAHKLITTCHHRMLTLHIIPFWLGFAVLCYTAPLSPFFKLSHKWATKWIAGYIRDLMVLV